MEKSIPLIDILIPSLGLIGTVILALSVNPVINAIAAVFRLKEKELELNIINYDKIILTGLDNHIKNFSGKKTTCLVFLGLLFVGVSYLLQFLQIINR